MFAALVAAVALSLAPVGQVPPGTVAVEAPTDLPPAEGEVFADAVAQALAGANFQPLPSPGHSRYVARFTVVRTERGAVNTRIARERARGAAGNWAQRSRCRSHPAKPASARWSRPSFGSRFRGAATQPFSGRGVP